MNNIRKVMKPMGLGMSATFIVAEKRLADLYFSNVSRGKSLHLYGHPHNLVSLPLF